MTLSWVGSPLLPPGIPVSFFFFFSLSFSGWLWSTGALWVHLFARVSKTQSGRCLASSGEGTPCVFTPPRGRLWPLWIEQVWCHGFIGFLCKTKKIKPLFLPFIPFLFRWCHSSWGYPWILLGLDPGSVVSSKSLALVIHWSNAFATCVSWWSLGRNQWDEGANFIRYDSFTSVFPGNTHSLNYEIQQCVWISNRQGGK